MKRSYQLLLLFILVFTNVWSQNSSYKILRKINLPGNGGWDYLTVDTLYDRLFVSHATCVQVTDLKTGNLVHTIENTKGVHGISIAYDLQKGYISNGKDTSVFIFSLRTLETEKRIKVTGLNPDAILYDPFSHNLFVFNGRSDNITVIDTKTETVVATIAVEGKPEFAVTDMAGKIYVNIENKSEICRINSQTLKVEKYWSLAPAEEPSGLAIDTKNKKLFSVCDNKMMAVSDIVSEKVIATVPTGDGTDGAAFDPALNLAFSSNGEGTLTIVKEENPTTFKVLENISTQKGARTIALNPKTHHVFLPAADYANTPEPTKENPHPRPQIKAESFVILELGK